MDLPRQSMNSAAIAVSLPAISLTNGLKRAASSASSVWIAVAEGMDPESGAGTVIEAIRRDQFWIFSHPRVRETARRQAVEMAEDNSLVHL